MSRFRSTFILQIPRDQAHVVSCCAVAKLGWIITDETDGRVTCREQVLNLATSINPVRLAISFEADHDGCTEVTINGANFGAGPVQWGHVRAQVEQLAQEIEAGAARCVRPVQRGKSARNVRVNNARLTDQMVVTLEHELGRSLVDGAYWYDRVSGAWGLDGGPTLCLIRPGLVVGGPLRANASNGTSGVFVNGRELDDQDAAALGRLVDLPPGRFWVDAHGNFGPEGGPGSGNLIALARAQPVRPSGARRRPERLRSLVRERPFDASRGAVSAPLGEAGTPGYEVSAPLSAAQDA